MESSIAVFLSRQPACERQPRCHCLALGGKTAGLDSRYSAVGSAHNTSWPKRQQFDLSSPTMTHKACEAMGGWPMHGQCIQRVPDACTARAKSASAHCALRPVTPQEPLMESTTAELYCPTRTDNAWESIWGGQQRQGSRMEVFEGLPAQTALR